MDFNSTNYQERANHCFLDSSIVKIIDASCVFRDSTEAGMSNVESIFYLNDDLVECGKHNMTMHNGWSEYDESIIPPYGDGMVIKFANNNPYNLKWLWRTDGNYFVSHGQITSPSFSKKYQNSSWTTEKISDNIYVTDCVDFNVSTLRDEIVDASFCSMADMGALACTTTGEYKICSRGPSERNADFKKWLISIINPNTLILAEDTNLIISIAIGGGMAKSLHKNNWIGKIKNLFKIDSTLN